jgi:hypothetical protein
MFFFLTDFSPSNVTILKTTDTGVSIQWIQAPTCYERAGIAIFLFKSDNSSIMFKVHKDATTFDLTGLSPETTYRFEMFTKYGNESFFVNSTNPPKFSFVTAEEGRRFYIIFTLCMSMEMYLSYFQNTVCVLGGGR